MYVLSVAILAQALLHHIARRSSPSHRYHGTAKRYRQNDDEAKGYTKDHLGYSIAFSIGARAEHHPAGEHYTAAR